MSAKLTSETEKISYALGMNVGQSLAQTPLKLEIEPLLNGISDSLKGEKPALSQDEYVAAIKTFQEKSQAAEQEAMAGASKENINEQNEFLEKNKNTDGIVTTNSGLQYKVLQKGEGSKPKASDTVRVHYTGTLLDGTEFDSSVKRGEPAEFGVGQVIKGWTEALQLMNVGSKYKLYIPSELAYGDRGAGNVIGPGAMLIFDVELLDII